MEPSDTPLSDRILTFASSEYAFDHAMVHAIDSHLNPRELRSRRWFDMAYTRKETILLTGMESFNLKIWQIIQHLRDTYDHVGPITAQVFISQEGSPDVGWHADAEGTWLKVLSGHKTVHFENGANTTKTELRFDDSLYISPGVRYRTFNKKGSILLVVKLGQFIEDVIS